MRAIHLLFVIYTSALSFQASAGPPRVADPDVYADLSGMTSPVVNAAFPGVTLSTENAPADVFALGAGEPTSSFFPAVFGHGVISFPSGGCSGCWSFGYAELRADFERRAKWVTVEFVDRFPGTVSVIAYDKNDQIITSASTILRGATANEAQVIPVQVRSKGPAIAYVRAAAESGVYGLIDKITWQPAGK